MERETANEPDQDGIADDPDELDENELDEDDEIDEDDELDGEEPANDEPEGLSGTAPPPPRRTITTDPRQFKIDKGVPLPSGAIARKRRSPWVAFLKHMEIGDSIEMPHVPMSRLYNVRKIAIKHGMAIELRNEGDGTRLWKVHPSEVDDGL